MHRILVVEDDAAHAKFLKFLLGDEGYQVTTADSAPAALAYLEHEPFDLIVLDIMLPGMDGLELCRHIRATNPIPIMFVSALADVKDKVLGLRTGGDDYIAKPFDPNEVLARIWALLRRTCQPAQNEPQLRHTALTLDQTEHTVRLHRSGKTVRLTPIEARLLHVLLSNAGRGMTREALVIKVWGHAYERSSNQLDVYVSRLRSKLEENPNQPRMLLTLRGIGYRFQPTSPGRDQQPS